MQCTNPIQMVNKNATAPDGSDRIMTVPCGKCTACRISRTREWKVRLLHELEYHADCVFLTLTYDDEFLPENGSLVKLHVQLFLKRLRKRLDHKIKYYFVGEYGDNTYRPHYHAILFGLGPQDLGLFQEVWTYGFVCVGTVTPDSIGYVCGYIHKKLFGDMSVLYGESIPPFSLMSKGLGLQFAIDHQVQLKQMGHVTVGGVPQGLPRYYVKKLDFDTDSLRRVGEIKRNEVIEYWESRGSLEADTLRSIDDARKQHDANLKGKLSQSDRSKI